MKIAFLSNESPIRTSGGVGSFVSCLAPALAALGHEVHVVSCAPHRATADLEVDGYWVHERPAARLVPSGLRDRATHTTMRIEIAVAAAKAYRSLGLRADVIEQPDWMAEGLRIAPATRSVATLHTPVRLIMEHNDIPVGRDIRWADALERRAVSRASVVTSPSLVLTGALTGRGWLRRAPDIIRLPVDVASWSQVPDAASTGPTVLCVGRLEPRKAPETALDALAALRDVPGAELVFVGRSGIPKDGVEYARWLRRRAEATGVRIHVVDEVNRSDLAQWYARARVVVVPSRFDSFSMAGAEAMAAGRPIVCSDRVGVGELLDGTDAGAIVPVGDITGFADALRPYLTDADLAAKAGARARELVTHHCEPQIIARRHEALYERIAA